MSRWTVTPVGGDADTTFTFPMNPNKIDLEALTVNGQWQQMSVVGGSGFIGTTGRPSMMKLSFAGVMPTQAAYDGLVALTAGPRHTLVDDLGRTWTIRVLEVHPSTKAPMRIRQPWRHTYTAVALILPTPEGAE